MSGKTVKLVGWQPQQKPPKTECQAMLPIIVEAVFSLHHESDLPLQQFSCNINQIYKRCQKKVREKRDRGEWDFPYRGRETWKRRMQEAAYPENGAKIVSITAGVYRPSPALFQGGESQT